MKSLVINAGSSSVKFQVFDSEEPVLAGACEEIGRDGSRVVLGDDKLDERIESHEAAFRRIVDILKERGFLNDLDFVVHRVVHGGEKFRKPTVVNEEVISELKKISSLAPLHNPANIEGIELMREFLPHVEHVAVFDTAFHSSLKEEAFLYGVPYGWYEKHGVRKYGFHGSSHEYVIGEVLKMLEKDDALPLGVPQNTELGGRIINCHLGNGASVCASVGGVSVDTSMGMTPLEGNVMGTRSGSLDPGVIRHMVSECGMDVDEVFRVLNKESGLKGLSEISGDMRPLEENMNSCERSARAMKVYLYRLVQIIGSYVGVMGGVDAIVFTGGSGEKSGVIRKYVADKFKFLGIELDEEKNKKNEKEITKEGSRVRMFVVKTNEELQMVRNARKVLKRNV